MVSRVVEVVEVGGKVEEDWRGTRSWSYRHALATRDALRTCISAADLARRAPGVDDHFVVRSIVLTIGRCPSRHGVTLTGSMDESSESRSFPGTSLAYLPALFFSLLVACCRRCHSQKQRGSSPVCFPRLSSSMSFRSRFFWNLISPIPCSARLRPKTSRSGFILWIARHCRGFPKHLSLRTVPFYLLLAERCRPSAVIGPAVWTRGTLRPVDSF